MAKTFDADVQLRWTQPSAGKSRYELHDITGDLYGTLERTSIWNNKAVVDAPGARLELDRKWTWLKYYVTVTSVGTEQEIARFTYGTWGGGTLTFANGAEYKWKSNAWGNKYAWVTNDKDEDLILGFAVGGFMKQKADVHFDMADPQGVVLVFLGWYLYTLQVQDAAMAAVVAAT